MEKRFLKTKLSTAFNIPSLTKKSFEFIKVLVDGDNDVLLVFLRD